MSREALADELEALNPGFAERAEQVGGIAVAPDADAVVADTSSFRYLDCPRCGGMLKPDIVYFGESVPKERVQQAFSLVDGADALLVAGSSLTVFSGYRFVRHAAAAGKPIAIVNRGPTRGDALATVKLEAGCSELLTLLAGELTAPRRALERAGHRADGVDEVAPEVGGLAGGDIGQLGQQLTEERPELRPGNMRAQAEMPPTATKTQMRVWFPAEVQPFRDGRRPRCPSCPMRRT